LRIAFIANPESVIGGDAYGHGEHYFVPLSDYGGAYFLDVNEGGGSSWARSCPELDGIDALGFMGHEAYLGDGAALVSNQIAGVIAVSHIEDDGEVQTKRIADSIMIAPRDPIAGCRGIPGERDVHSIHVGL